jgi:hypothetical protein
MQAHRTAGSVVAAAAICCVLLVTGAISVLYGYDSYNRISVSQYLQATNGGPTHAWIPEFRLRWYLSHGDNLRMWMVGVNATIDPEDLLFGFSIFLGISPQTLETNGLIQAWNLTWAQWMSYPDQMVTINFNASHYYDIQMSMYNNGSNPTAPLLYSEVSWHDPANTSAGESLIGYGIILLVLSVIPPAWTISQKHGSVSESATGSAP